MADTAVPEDQQIRVLDKAGDPVAGAVVWFEGSTDSGLSGAPQTAVIDQIDKQFVPRITVVPVGASVEFPNSDSVSHHVYSFSRPNAFELPLYKNDQKPLVRFESPGVVTLGCNIHDAMLGYIVIIDAADFAMTDADGYASLTRPGEAGSLRVWSERLDPREPLAASAKSSGPVWSVARRQKPERRHNDASLAWEDY